MPNGDGWKETFKFFIKELEEVYLPNLRDLWNMIVPTSPLLGEPEKDIGEIPQPVPAPSPPPTPLPDYPGTEPFQPTFPMYPAAGRPPGELSQDIVPYPSRTPEPFGTPTPMRLFFEEYERRRQEFPFWPIPRPRPNIRPQAWPPWWRDVPELDVPDYQLV